MSKNKIMILLLVLFIIGIGCFLFFQENTTSREVSVKQDENIVNNENINIEDKENDDMKLIIDNKEYQIELENNPTVDSFLELLPLEIEMSELNGNEKYYYLDQTLPTDSSVPSQIQKGDVMLYGNNCIVIFYKSFHTTYSYTKIGHIQNLPDLDRRDIQVTLEK